MPIDLTTHRGEEVTYLVDDLRVKGLMITPKQSVKRIVVYLRGGKGKVGRVRTGRLLQFANDHTLVFGLTIAVTMAVKAEMNSVVMICMM